MATFTNNTAEADVLAALAEFDCIDERIRDAWRVIPNGSLADDDRRDREIILPAQAAQEPLLPRINASAPTLRVAVERARVILRAFPDTGLGGNDGAMVRALLRDLAAMEIEPEDRPVPIEELATASFDPVPADEAKAAEKQLIQGLTCTARATVQLARLRTLSADALTRRLRSFSPRRLAELEAELEGSQGCADGLVLLLQGIAERIAIAKARLQLEAQTRRAA